MIIKNLNDYKLHENDRKQYREAISKSWNANTDKQHTSVT